MSGQSQPSDGRAVIADVRRDGIAEILRAAGSVTVAEVEQRFGVSSMTARRDLAELERRGVARRTHGGAVLPSITAHEDSFLSRLQQSTGAKGALAGAAAAMVGEEESVFLDSSSTAYHVARALIERGLRLTLITNSQPIMDLVASHPSGDVELIGVGGSLRRLTRSFVGPLATGAIRAHYADKAFFSVKGVTPDGALTDADTLEAEVKRSMLEHAHESVLLVDRTKLDSRGMTVIEQVDAVSLVLGCGMSQDDVASLTALGARVRAVPEEGM